MSNTDKTTVFVNAQYAGTSLNPEEEMSSRIRMKAYFARTKFDLMLGFKETFSKVSHL